eukprot:TRINITY_DN739_c0_g1_i5.p1 TRINITY_DN739_c0_g1~~TRINITY_DN739_c0_g1_i5.p1  ORF type:complete len:542 (-),score=14.49 TRINITY_DN739_c0_g1_i5:237-1862(-)
MIIYLTKKFNMPNVTASYVVNLWQGTCNISPLVGAFLSDSYIGRFWTISLGCLATFLGMILLTLTAIFPEFRPPECAGGQTHGCVRANAKQNALLFMSYAMLTVGSAGIRPCSAAFGADQFDGSTKQGRKDIQSFFNWYYFSFTTAMMVSLTLVVYIQDSVSWSLGLAIPAVLMLVSIIVFFAGKGLYVLVKPEGSSFTSFAQVLAAAFRKRHLKLPSDISEYHDPPQASSVKSVLAFTHQFMFLNKACIEEENDRQSNGKADPWSLSSMQQVEELKTVLRIIPIWAGCLGFVLTTAQLSTFSVLQAETMDRQVTKGFVVPAGSFPIFTMITLTLFIPIYDRLIVPFCGRITLQKQGITMLQRIGVGQALSVLPMAVAALVESRRRHVALTNGFLNKPNGVIPMSALWLVPQYSIAGIAEAFTTIGLLEFLYSQFPENMRSVAGALFFLCLGIGHYLSSFIVSLVHRITRRHNWLSNNLNQSHLDLFYWIMAGIAAVNFVYFVCCARWYRYKAVAEPRKEKEEKELTTVDDRKDFRGTTEC